MSSVLAVIAGCVCGFLFEEWAKRLFTRERIPGIGYPIGFFAGVWSWANFWPVVALICIGGAVDTYRRSKRAQQLVEAVIQTAHDKQDEKKRASQEDAVLYNEHISDEMKVEQIKWIRRK